MARKSTPQAFSALRGSWSSKFHMVVRKKQTRVTAADPHQPRLLREGPPRPSPVSTEISQCLGFLSLALGAACLAKTGNACWKTPISHTRAPPVPRTPPDGALRN